MQGKIEKNILKQNEKQVINKKTIRYILIGIAIIILIISAIIIYDAYRILTYKNIYSGIYIEDVYVGANQKEIAIKNIKEKYKDDFKDKTITIEYNDHIKEIGHQEIETTYNIEKAVTEAFDKGRKENIFKRLYTISEIKRNNFIIPLEIEVNQSKIEKILQDLSKELDTPVEEYTYTRIDKNLKVKNGTRGWIINHEKATKKIIEAVKSADTNKVELKSEIILAQAVTVEDLYQKACQPPQDARYEVKNYKINIIDHKYGIDFDKNKAKDIINDNNNEGQEFYIPINLQEPKTLKVDIERTLFKNKLSEYTTNFNIQQVERSTNVVLSANKINGIILGPGDVFSYNNIVGRRTEEAGYQNAQIFVGGEIVDGLGGGICQVSSTLYNAALFSDLDIISRINHSLTVGYVPIGQDATVAYGSIDFKFKNNRNWPIKIIARANGGRVNMEIWGTSDGSNKIISIENKIIETIPYTTNYIYDDTIAEGQEIVKQKGAYGYLVDTYKIKKENGLEISRSKITNSRYNPLEQIIIIGTKKMPQDKIPVIVEEESQENNDIEQEERQETEENQGQEELETEEAIR